MNILVTRQWFTPQSTIGLLTVDDFKCYTLEPAYRTGAKIPNQTAIPEGTYNIVLYPSTRNHDTVPLLQNVPGFSYIEMHIGNSPKDTDGCLLLGLEKTVVPDYIYESSLAFHQLMPRIVRGLMNGSVSIKIENQLVSTV